MDKRFSIHEVAELLGISTDAIRLYEKSGLVTPLRNERNGYRYYNGEQIQQIMGISLYRKLNVGIAEIREMLKVADFTTMVSAFDGWIEKREEEIKIQQNRLDKLKVMKTHMAEIQKGVGEYCVKELPGRYIKQINTTGVWEYEKLKEIISTDLFSFGNIGYTLKHTKDGKDEKDEIEAFEFSIREPMMELCMEQIKKEDMIFRAKCNCIYTVLVEQGYEKMQWGFEALFSYAEKNGYHCTGEVFVFYVYSLLGEKQKVNYYEIYVPIL